MKIIPQKYYQAQTNQVSKNFSDPAEILLGHVFLIDNTKEICPFQSYAKLLVINKLLDSFIKKISLVSCL